jgi:hypothetical protein
VRGVLKKRKHRVSGQKKKYVGNNAKRKVYPVATGLGFLGKDTPTFCLFGY